MNLGLRASLDRLLYDVARRAGRRDPHLDRANKRIERAVRAGVVAFNLVHRTVFNAITVLPRDDE